MQIYSDRKGVYTMTTYLLKARPEEMRQWKEDAKKTGLTFAEYVRTLLRNESAKKARNERATERVEEVRSRVVARPAGVTEVLGYPKFRPDPK